jgi:hypothetical protein
MKSSGPPTTELRNIRVHFKLSLTAHGLSLHPHGVDSLEFRLARTHLVTVTLATPGEEDAAPGEQVICEARTDFEPNPRILAAFDRLAEDRLPDGHPPVEEFPSIVRHVELDGRISHGHTVSMGLMPEQFQTFAAQLHSELHEAAEAVLGVVRWRSRSLGPPQPFSGRGLQWSADDKSWDWMPSSAEARISVADRVELAPGAVAELKVLLDAGRREPLGHVLFREAWSQRYSNRRSSLLLGVTALEIGIKEYIAACVPDAEWLALESPSPPVVRMLTEYLPKLKAPEEGPGLGELDKDTLDALKAAVQVRNRLAHRGVEVESDRLLRTLRAIRNVLWSLDVALGQLWAESYLLSSLDDDPSQGYRRIGELAAQPTKSSRFWNMARAVHRRVTRSSRRP